MHCFIVILKLKTYLQFVTIISILILQLTTNCFCHLQGVLFKNQFLNRVRWHQVIKPKDATYPP